MAAAARMFGRDEIRADCRRCQTERDPATRAAIRAENGCDEPAKREVWWSKCYCDGAPDCERCGGTERVRFYRCPSSLCDGRRDLAAFVGAWNQYEGRHVLPAEGAWLDQTAQFVDGCAVMDRERNAWDDRKEQKRQREADAQRAHSR